MNEPSTLDIDKLLSQINNRSQFHRMAFALIVRDSIIKIGTFIGWYILITAIIRQVI